MAVLSIAVISPLVGCGRPDDGLSTEQQQRASRLDEIAKKSEGDWNKLSQADRDYLVKELSHGDEQQARMLLMSKTGFKGARPTGGPPAIPGRQ